MKYKRFVYTPLILFILSLNLVSSNEYSNNIRDIFEKYKHGSKLERIVAMWNRSSEHPQKSSEEEFNFDSEWDVNSCIKDHQFQITENVAQGKNIILNCFKTSLMLNMLKYLGESRDSSVKLFNGLLEIKKIPEDCREDNCENKYGRNLEMFEKKKNMYVKMYKKAMQKLINERSRLNAFRNQTEEEKMNQLNKIDENSEAFLSEVLKSLKNDEIEKVEEEKLKKEITDPKLMSLFDALSKNYMLKLRFYPGASARLMRSNNGGFTFDLELPEAEDNSEEEEEESLSNESMTREIKYRPQAKDGDYFDDDDDDESSGNKKRKSKKDKQKKKAQKQKMKALKKIIPYLLLPMLIQMTILPLVFKKLFFLAMKALFAGKVALILIGFNLLRNTCIRNEDDYAQKIRVEHYGYKKGEEYGAWINGRSLQDPTLIPALSEEPFRSHKPVVA